MNQSGKESSVPELLASVRKTLRARAARPGQSMRGEGPLFTFLVGAGFSLSAGVPSTNHLTSALELFQLWINKLDGGEELDALASPPERLDWEHIFEVTSKLPPSSGLSYYELMDSVLPLPPARHDFITAAIQWAANNRLQMTEESILLAALLVAGARGLSANQAAPEGELASVFARHIFTTNFDELMPITFYIGNRPADIVDSMSFRMIDDTPEFPTIVYLHGRHIHYDLKNTPEELKHQFFGEAAKELDLFAQFRRVLRKTGLIVIGYSGAEDRVMDAIEDALNDPHSLPYGLWWAGYRDKTSLSPRARSLVEGSLRASYLLPPSGQNLPALRIIEDICSGVGLDSLEARIEWVDRAQRIARATDPLLLQVLESIREFMKSARDTYYNNYSYPELQKALAAWDRRIKGFIEKVSDLQPKLAAEVMNLVTLMLRHTRRFDEAMEMAHWTLRVAVASGDPGEIGDANWHVAQVYLQTNRAHDARPYLLQALENHMLAGYFVGAANVRFGLGDAALREGDVKEALVQYQEALKLQVQENNLLGQANGYEAMGDAYLEMRSFDEAEAAYLKARELHGQVGSRLGQGNDCQGLSSIYVLRGDVETANRFKLEAIEHMQGIEHKEAEAEVHANFGANLMYTGRYDAALEAFNEALRTEPSRNIDFLICICRWARKDPGTLDAFRLALERHGPIGEFERGQLSTLVREGRVTQVEVDELYAQLGLENSASTRGSSGE